MYGAQFAGVALVSARAAEQREHVQVIFVGALESEAEGTDGKLHRAVGQTFGEIDDCWQFLDYFTVLRCVACGSESLLLTATRGCQRTHACTRARKPSHTKWAVAPHHLAPPADLAESSLAVSAQSSTSRPAC